MGFVVAQAKTGLGAIEQHRKFKPDLTIMDQVMPEMNGLDAILDIQEYQPTAKFIMLTSTCNTEERVTAETLSVCRYLLKPLQFSDLMSAITDTLIDSSEKKAKEKKLKQEKIIQLKKERNIKSGAEVLVNAYAHWS